MKYIRSQRGRRLRHLPPLFIFFVIVVLLSKPLLYKLDMARNTDNGTEISELPSTQELDFNDAFDGIYRLDLDGDDTYELLSIDMKNGTIEVIRMNDESEYETLHNLNETARDYLKLPFGTEVLLNIPESFQMEEVIVSWSNKWTGNSGVQEISLAELYCYEKGRNVFYDCYPLTGIDGITVVLKEFRFNENIPDFYEVVEIQVYEKGKLIQAIETSSITYEGTYLYEGLFINKRDIISGMPDVRDFNFDGISDIGILVAKSRPYNIPYAYFIWNQEMGQLESPFICFSNPWLDIETQEFIEYKNCSRGIYWYNHYRFVEGKFQLVWRQEEDNSCDVLDSVWLNTYSFMNGETVCINHEVKPHDWLKQNRWYE